MWARGTVVTGAHLVATRTKTWSVSGGVRAHQGESISHKRGKYARCTQGDFVSEGHPTLGLGKNHETAAVVAVETVADVRDRDDGRKVSAAKAAEELEGYFSECRLQVLIDRSCLDPGWEAIAREFEDSKLNMHLSIKARTGQTSVKGELETSTCAIMA